MVDRDLDELFDVETKQLKRQVRRNIDRFPQSFMFELSKNETVGLRSQFGTLKQGDHFKYAPFVFSEHGILMLTSVLNSEIAIKMSIQIIDTFVQLRKYTKNSEKLNEKIASHDEQLLLIFEYIKQFKEEKQQ